jgi:hypothetical protein
MLGPAGGAAKGKGVMVIDIEGVIAEYEEHLMQLPNVIGVGSGQKSGKEVIIVMVTRKVPASSLQPHEIVPKRLGGYRTSVKELGFVSAQANEEPGC